MTVSTVLCLLDKKHGNFLRAGEKLKSNEIYFYLFTLILIERFTDAKGKKHIKKYVDLWCWQKRKYKLSNSRVSPV